MARYVGGTGPDVYTGTAEDDQIGGGDGADRLFGMAGADRINGGAGNDLLSSNGIIDGFTATLADQDAVADRVIGGEGDDVIGGGWNDTLEGGVGTDVLYLDLRGADRGVTLDLGRLATGRSVRNGAGLLSGFEGYAAIQLTAFDDDIRLGGLKNYGVLGGGVYGGDGDDRIDAGSYGSGGGNQLTAASLHGGDGDDMIIGSSGSDSLFGDAGNDRLIAGDGNDTIYAGSGDDMINLRSTGTKFVIGDDGVDTILLSGARADYDVTTYDSNRGLFTISDNNGFQATFSGIERLTFTDGTVAFRNLLPGLVLGTAGDDRIDPSHPGVNQAFVTDGADELYGLDGDDILDGGRGADTFYGGDGADTFILDDIGDRVVDGHLEDIVFSSVSYVADYSYPYYFGVGRIELTGTADIDATDRNAGMIMGNAGNNRLTGDFGTILEGGFGDDTLVSWNGGSWASYEHAAARVIVDLARGDAQDTRGAGSDTLIGISRVIGSRFNDRLSGDDSSDTLEGGGGADRLDGRGGEDFASYARATSGVAVDLRITGAQDTIGAGRDTLVSIEGVFGSGHADRIDGTAARDTLAGGAGDDVIAGHGGADLLQGDRGADRFVFDALGDAIGTVVDFNAGEGDRVDLSLIDADTNNAGDQAFHLVAAFTGRAGELLVADNGRIPIFVSGDVDGDGVADFTVALQTYAPPPDTAFIL